MAVLDLDEPANQTRFSRLVGSSQQAISKMVEKGVLRRGGTIGEWLLQYSERLREIAGGRGGDNQADLTTAKTEEEGLRLRWGGCSITRSLVLLFTRKRDGHSSRTGRPMRTVNIGRV